MEKMMRYTLRLVFLICLAGAGNVWATEEPASVELPDLVDSLDQNISDLRHLNQQIDTVAKTDREALIYRRDQRSFELLVDMDTLARRTAALAADDPVRIETERRLREDLAAAANAVFQRIDKLGARIVEHKQEMESLSGGQRIALEAYVNSLETMRVQYYEALVNIIDGRKALDMDVAQMSGQLEDRLYLHAETLVGRIEFSGSAVDELQAKLAQDQANAELDATLKTFGNLHGMNLARLESIAGLLSRLGLDDSVYKSIMLQQGQGLSVRDIEGAVVLDLLRDAWASLRESLLENSPDMLFRVLMFLLVLLVFRALSRLVKRAVGAACDRPGVDISNLLRNVLVSVSGGTVMSIGVLMALSQVGISLGPMLAGLGVAGFVVGFALQDTLANFAAGGMILIYRPYDVDDFVEVTGASGLVRKMSLVSTTITTFDNQTLVVPNSKIWGDVIKNVTAQKVRRVDLEFGIGYSDDIEHAERVLHEVVGNHELVLDKPEPLIKLHTLGDSSVNFVVRPWTKTADYWDVYWDLTREVKMRFDKEGISIPFPQRDVHLFNEGAA